jgi:murein L,D-transpeptidase YafK
LKLKDIKYVVYIIITFLFTLNALPTIAAKHDPCKRQKTALLIDTSSHTMWMCQNNNEIAEFHISIGQCGIGKRCSGDKKTPLGEYELGLPKPSEKFRFFIPIGYPNAEQSSEGYTGGNIGIHGPHRGSLWLGKDSTMVDWTYGCIAVSTDEDIIAVAQWVQDQVVKKVIIR